MITKEKFQEKFKEYFLSNKQRIAAAAVGDEVALQAITNEIYDTCLEENSIFESQYSDFLASLSATEKQACRALLSTLDSALQEGDISINTLVKENSISRPVFKNLLVKMEKYSIAAFQNRGVKGTHIKIIDPEVFNI